MMGNGLYVGERPAAEQYTGNDDKWWDVPAYVRQEFYVSDPEDIQAAVNKIIQDREGYIDRAISKRRAAKRKRELSQVGSRVCKAQRKARRA